MAAYAYGKKAIGYCDRCGFQYPLHELKQEVVNLNVTNMLVCPECWDPDQPQTQLGRYHASDPQALQNPRPPLGLSDSRDGYRTGDEQYVESFNFADGNPRVAPGHTGVNINGMVFHNGYTLGLDPFGTAKMSLNPLSNTVDLVGEGLLASASYQTMVLTYDSVYAGDDATRVIDSSQYKTIEVRMRKKASGTAIDRGWNVSNNWRFLWHTSSSLFGSGGNYFSPNPMMDSPLGKLGDGWFTMSIDLSKNPDWTGNGTDITAWRFWMGSYLCNGESTNETDTIELDYLNFYKY